MRVREIKHTLIVRKKRVRKVGTSRYRMGRIIPMK